MSLLSIEQIKEQRRIKQIDLHRLYKHGHIFKDYRGYFLKEESYPFFIESKLHSFYVEEEYKKMELSLEQLLQKASAVEKELKSTAAYPDAIMLMGIDYEIYQILTYYRGDTHLPILSYRQLRAWMSHEKSFHYELEILSCNESPLQSLQIIAQVFGKRKFKQWKKQYSEQPGRMNLTNRLLQALPYRSTFKNNK